MTTNDNAEDNVDLDLEDEEEGADGEGEKGNEKPKETPEARHARLTRQLAQSAKKLGLDTKPDAKKEDKKEEVLDRIDRAVLRTEKITDPDEIALVETIMKDTGKNVEGVLASKYFQSELKSLRDDRSAEDAMPANGKRSNTSSRNNVDYWITKGELPPASEPELRRKVVNEKIRIEKSTNKFSDNPVI